MSITDRPTLGPPPPVLNLDTAAALHREDHHRRRRGDEELEELCGRWLRAAGRREHDRRAVIGLLMALDRLHLEG